LSIVNTINKKNLEKGIPSKKRINHENFDQFIGKKIHYLDYVDFFRDEIEEIGLKETLGKYIPKFSSSILFYFIFDF